MADKKEQSSASLPQRQGYRASPVMALRDQMDRMFDDFFSGRFMRPGNLWDMRLGHDSGMAMAAPNVDVVEKDDEILVTAELPGMKEDEVEVTLDQGLLTIHGEKKSEEQREEGRVVVSERHFGSFERRIALPEGIDEEKCSASFDNGVLSVRLQRQPGSSRQGRRIPIGKQ